MKDLSFLLPYFKKYKSKFQLGFLFIVLSNTISVYIPLLVKNAIDAIKDIKLLSDIYRYLIAIFSASLVAGIFRYYIRQTIIAASRLIENDMREDFWKKTLSLSPKNFEQKSIGAIMALATNDISSIRLFVGPAIMYLTDTFYRSIFVLYNMITINWHLTIYSLIPFPILGILTYYISSKVFEIFSKIQEQFGNLTERAREAFSGVRAIKAFNAEEQIKKAFNNESFDYMKKALKLVKLEALFQPGLYFFAGSSMAIILYVGGIEIINNRLTVGELTAFLIYSFMLIWPIIAFGWVANINQQAKASAKRLREWIQIESDIKFGSNENLNIELKGRIEFKGVKFKYYDSQEWILNDINLKIRENKITAIVGKTGCGKTTTANLIARLYDPVEGKIEIDGIDIKKIPLKVLRNEIAYVMQEPFLFSDTIKNNLLYGTKKSYEIDVEFYAKLAKLHNDVKEFPSKYETSLGEKGINLSGGQKQRAAIAQALIREAKIYIFDDSFSAVDSKTESEIIEELKNYLQNKTTIIITHKISIASKADEIIVMENGKVVEQGTHIELLLRKGYYSELFEKQSIEKELEELE